MINFDNSVPFNPSAVNRMNWETLVGEAAKLEEEDHLWTVARAKETMQLAGLFGTTDVLGPRDHQAYKDATGGSLTGNDSPVDRENPKEVMRSGYQGIGGPNTQVVKSQAELRNQAEMMVRNGRLGTVQGAMKAIQQDWLERGYKIR